MAIRVTCTGCKTRFNVSDSFAGKSGPCPKCKTVIKIPDKSEEVVVHAPQDFGPKDSTGRSVLKPIFREETKVTSVGIALLVASMVVVLGGALAVRFLASSEAGIPLPVLVVGAIALAPPLSWAGYAFLRNQELDSYHGMEMWGRVIGTSLVFAVLWLFFPAVLYALNADEYTYGVSGSVLLGILAAGGGVAMVAWDHDYLIGCVHYGLYLLVCLILRAVAGGDFIPLG